MNDRLNIKLISKKTYLCFVFFSLFFLSFSIFSFLKNNVNIGADFTGGEVIYFKINNKSEIESFVNKIKSINNSIIVNNLDDNLTIKIPLSIYKDGNLKSILNENISKNKDLSLLRNESIGPDLSSDMLYKMIIALIVSIFSIMLYVCIRFSLSLSIISICGLLHDVFIAFGFIFFMKIELNTTTLAAILVILGYSINDTIVVFGKMKEFLNNNLKKYSIENNTEVINLTIYETFKRSILTSLTTILGVSVVYLIGDVNISNFAIISTIGILFGTYSSLFLNLSLILLKKVNLSNLIEKNKLDEKKKSVYHYNS